MPILLPNGDIAYVYIVPLFRRRNNSMKPYSRPTDWLAQAGPHTAWGPTRREAVANLKRMVSPQAGNVVRLVR
ncbi:hypothetical protein ACT4MK_19310 [Bradyrhizobium barranii]|uniref:hypothetical protein n=1 Tax=Bradyrhizobium TaxID=374 RepID=UPI003F264A8A